MRAARRPGTAHSEAPMAPHRTMSSNWPRCVLMDLGPDIDSPILAAVSTVVVMPVSKLRVNAFSVSADGFGAGPDQGKDQPLGRSPILLGQGEPLLEGIDLPALGYRVKEHVSTETAMHFAVGR
jgi:hypothetical protein